MQKKCNCFLHIKHPKWVVILYYCIYNENNLFIEKALCFHTTQIQPQNILAFREDYLRQNYKKQQIGKRIYKFWASFETLHFFSLLSNEKGKFTLSLETHAYLH